MLLTETKVSLLTTDVIFPLGHLNVSIVDRDKGDTRSHGVQSAGKAAGQGQDAAGQDADCIEAAAVMRVQFSST